MASLCLLAHPGTTASAVAADPATITASLRYGCPDSSNKDGFVEVSLQSSAVASGSDDKLVLAVGLAGPGSSTIDGVFLEGGPSLVTIGDGTTKVRLAGDIDKADHVFIRQQDQPDILTLPLHSACRNVTPIPFGLDQPSVEVAKKPCTSGSQANVSVSLDNPNAVDASLQRIGYEQLQYTVLLVREDGQLADGTQLAFDKPSTQSTTVGEVVTTPTPYQVRVIGVDGKVSATDISLSCAASQPGPPASTPTPPPTAPPTKTPPPTAPPTKTAPPTSPAPPVSTPPAASAPPTASVPPSQPTSAPSAPVSSAPTATGASSRPSAGSSQSASAGTVNPTGSAGSGESDGTGVVAGTPNQPGTNSSAAGSPAPVTSPSRVLAGRGPSSSTPIPRASESGATRLVVEAPQGLGAAFVFQKNVALVVLVFAAAIAALVGGTVVSARRR